MTANTNFIKPTAGTTTGGAFLWDQFADALSGKNDTDVELYAPLSAPPAPTAAAGSAGTLTGTYQWGVIFVTGYFPNDTGSGSPQVKGNTGVGTWSSAITLSAQNGSLSNLPIGGAGVVQRIITRTKAGGSVMYEVATIDNTETTYTDSTPDSSLTVVAPTTNTTGGKYYGDGSQLTGLTPTQVGAAATAAGLPYAADTSNTANTITATVSPAPGSYTDGYSVRVKVAATTTGAATLNVNGLGAIAIKNADGTAVGAGDLVAGVPRIFTYVAATTPFFVASGSGGLSASGNATPADVRINVTFTSESGRTQTGTLADNGNGPTVNPTTTTQTFGAGIYDTPITVNPVTGTAAAGDVRTGKTASSANGIDFAGTLAEVAGGNTITPGPNSQTAIAANTIANAAITVAGVTVDATKVLTGTNIAGTAGTMPNNGYLTTTPGQTYGAGYYTGITGGGKQSANGTVTSAGSLTSIPSAYTDGSSSSASLAAATVTGLNFTPSMVVLIDTTNGEVVTLTSKQAIPTGYNNMTAINQNVGSFVTSVNGSLVSGGFTAYVRATSTSYNWYAYE